jgi:malate dehydrogenase (oxaloacetate-decarboxylating)
LDTLREKAEIPIWHDDQQGTAMVTLAGLINALKVVNKKMEDVRIVFVGSGASNVACSRLIFGWGADPANCIMVDSKGTLGPHRQDLSLCAATNTWTNGGSARPPTLILIEGGIPEALEGADVVIALSQPGPGVILPEWVERMNDDAIVFACANPVPEIWPWEAKAAGARIVATGRSDFPNQVNNSLGFPGIFRGALDVRATTITDEMCFAAAEALADHIGDALDEEHILPNMDDWDVFPREAAAVGHKSTGARRVARLHKSYDEFYEHAK